MDVDNEELSEFVLSKSSLGDGEAIRCVCFLSSSNDNSSTITSTAMDEGGGDDLLSGSDGGNITLHKLESNETIIGAGETPTRHPHHVTSLQRHPNGNLYVSGCRDGSIRLFDASTHNCIQTFSAGTAVISSLDFIQIPASDSSTTSSTTSSSSGGGGDDAADWYLVSGSWDGTARVWDITASSPVCVATLGGHENTASVAALPPAGGRGRIMTASAGVASGNAIVQHRLRLWDLTKLNPTFIRPDLISLQESHHTGALRALHYDPIQNTLITCSNDGTVKIRSAHNGDVLTTLAHPSVAASSSPPMFLSVASIAGSYLVAAGEDGSVVIWDQSSTSMPQLIPHPNTVWNVRSLPNGDFVTACHDGYIRTFTRNPHRRASTQDLQLFERAIQEAAASKSTGPSQQEIQSLTAWEMAPLNPGRSEGQVQMFNKSGVAIAAQWSATSSTWIEVGEVTGQNRNAGQIDGVAFDHVLPIEVDAPDGTVRKLQIGYNNGQNPFVAAQQFIDDNSLPQYHLAEIADYIRTRVGDAGGPTLGSAPTAATNSHMPSSSTPTPTSSSSSSLVHLPAKGYRSFEAGSDAKKTLNKIYNKALEFNASQKPPSFSSNDIDETLDRNLVKILANTSRYHATTIPFSSLTLLERAFNSWTITEKFPILDLLRLAVLHPDASKLERMAYWSKVLSLALSQCEDFQSEEEDKKTTGGPTEIAIPMLTLRLCANCFRGGDGSLRAVSGLMNRVLKCAQSNVSSTNKNIRLSVATVLLNASVAILKENSEHKNVIESIAMTALDSNVYEAEATIRCLVALGTVLYNNNTKTKTGASSSIKQVISKAVTLHGETTPMVKMVASELESLL